MSRGVGDRCARLSGIAFGGLVFEMRYVVFGRVQPERADVWLSGPQVFRTPNGHVYTVRASSSQLTVIADVPEGTGHRDVFVMAEHFAEVAVSALSFAHGTGWHVELVQVVSEEVETYGVRPGQLEFDPAGEMFSRALELGKRDLYFRLALRDYVRAMRDTLDCAHYCYRAIEAIKSAFDTSAGASGWTAMHTTIGTTREEIGRVVKDFADPVRHGNWANFPAVTAAQRHEMLTMTRRILANYVGHVSPPSLASQPTSGAVGSGGTNGPASAARE